MSQELFVRLARLVMLVTAFATAAMLVVPFLAIATGAYPPTSAFHLGGVMISPAADGCKRRAG